VDRFGAAAPQQLARAVIPQRRDRSRADEPDHALGIHHPDRLRPRLEHRGEQALDADPQAGQISQEIRHGKLRAQRFQATDVSCQSTYSGPMPQASQMRGYVAVAG
jgi:hypothetical protein